MKILIVEDDLGITDLVSESLSELGFETSIAFSGRSAIEIIKNDSPGLVLLDYSLPDMTAKELIISLNKNEIKVPMFIVSTGQGDERIAVEMMKLGAYDYLTKDAAFFARLPEVVSRAVEDLNSKRRLAEIEKTLIESEEKHRLLFETMTQGVVYQDAEGKILFVNAAAERILGLSMDQLKGKKSVDPRWKGIHEDGLDFPGETHPAMVALQTGKKVNNVIMGIYNPVIEGYTYVSINAVPLFKDGEEKPYQVYATLEDITERKQAEDALRKSEKSYRGLFNSIQQAIYIQNEDGTFLDVNDGALKMYGYSREELIGKTPDLISAPDKNNFPEVISKIQKAFNGEPQEFEFWGKRKNGEIFPKHVKVYKGTYLDKDVVIAIAEDITQRKLAENALKASEEKYRSLINTMPNGFYRSTPEGYFVEANPAFINMLGYDNLEELKKINIPKEIYVQSEERDEVIAKNPEFVNTIESYRLKTKDGRIIWLEDNARYVRDENDKILFHEGICRDITERKNNEMEIKRYTAELETLNEELRFSKSIIEENLNARNILVEELEKINAEKDKFFSIIAHDLKSPFHAFLGLTGMMAENISDFSIDELAELSKEMHSKANNLFKLLKNLLEWARMQRGSMTFNPTEIDVSKFLKEIINSFSTNATQKEILILNKINSRIILIADENMLNSLFQNLLGNAIKFTKRGGEIVVSASFTNQNKSVIISVKDSGIGMTGELLDKLFKIEEKVGHEGTEGEESTGLGLLLCKEFVLKHEGKIWATSEPQVGSTFFVELPLHDAAV